MANIRIGIVGFGLIGEQRARDIKKIREAALVAVADVNRERLQSLQPELGYEIEYDWKKLVARDDIDLVIVAVPHFLAAEIVIAAAMAGKHVLCEKPLGMDLDHARAISAAVKKTGVQFEPGFNYRFYPGIQKVKELMSDEKNIGTVTHVRWAFGHGGRRGMEKEWRVIKKFSGGGALLDPGVHVIDLVRFLFGEPKEALLRRKNSFWKTDVEDNAFLFFATDRDVFITAHVNLTEWKNRFRMEIFGTDGYIFLTGRSKGYGPQEVRMGRRWFFEHNDEEKVWTYPLEDVSFGEELKAFIERINGKPAPALGALEDGLRAMEIIDGLYRGAEGA